MQGVTLGHSDVEKLLAEQNILQFLDLLKLLQGDNGILNPAKIFSADMMNYLKSSNVCHYISVEALENIKKSLQDTIAQSNKDTLVEKLIPVMVSNFEQLEMFPEREPGQQILVARDFVQNAIETTKQLTPAQRADSQLEKHFIEQFFQIFLQRNKEEAVSFTRDQIADLAKIQSSLVVMLSKANIGL